MTMQGWNIVKWICWIGDALILKSGTDVDVTTECISVFIAPK